jgi:lipid II:glycine glycyltransferase (peptidoglycan interpeptide bridge formation enzyme)
MAEVTYSDWNASLLKYPLYHLFQTDEWANIKSKYGWQASRLEIPFGDGLKAIALVLERSHNLLPFMPPSRVLYVPRGPLADWGNLQGIPDLLDSVERHARERRAIFIKIDPEILLGRGIPGEDGSTDFEIGKDLQRMLISRGWVFSQDQIQFRNSVWIDLRPGEEAILAGMKQKTRYNIKLCSKKGVVIRKGGKEDFEKLFQLYAQTSLRDDFTIRDRGYYLDVWTTFLDTGMAVPLIAEYDGLILAGLFLFHFGKKSWYLYGMSSDEHRDLMPNYGLQWEAIRLSIELGCETYDLWGAPDHFDGDDRMAGVFRFKMGLGGEVVRTLGAWDFPARRTEYALYTRILPRILALMRKRGRQTTEREAGG